ncbi:EAL domain-containing protein [Pelagibaculum spongiae]|uniref:EAL domain-containing protein n=1 Tax=Pelagibaculum spongiae TaxID=2080658 RepID=A0A2V1GU26_9GAMM|nr:GGDEF domain-containing protein [Pelagibaculum spongiae]PVZ65678.1 hypothetical protein DC094_17490 [Pelagibaculum spongiae]
MPRSNLETLYLLLLDDNSQRSQSVIRLLREAGFGIRSERIDNLSGLEKSLQGSQWDVCIASENLEHLAQEQAIQTIFSYQSDVAILWLTDNQPDLPLLAQQLEQGISDCISLQQSEHLKQVVRREFENLRVRRLCQTEHVRANEAEARCEQLLSNSSLAISYLTDGMHIHANNTYCELFGIEDIEELTCLPVMDLVAREDQKRLAEHLRHPDQQLQVSETFMMHSADGSRNFLSEITFSSSVFESESCIQLQLQTGNSSLISHDLLDDGRCQHKNNFLEKLETLLERNPTGWIVLTSPDQIEDVREKYGELAADHQLHALQNLLDQELPHEYEFCRLNDGHLIVLIPNENRESVTELFCKLYEKADELLIDTGDTTLTVNAHFGMVSLSSAKNVVELTKHAGQALKLSIEKKTPIEILAHKPIASDNNDVDPAMVQMIFDAMTNQDMFLNYQPIVSLHGTPAETYEAYLRLKNPEGDMVSPGNFFPTAIKAGICDQLDLWILEKLCHQLKKEQDKGRQIRLFMIVSGQSYNSPVLAEKAQQLTNTLEIPPRSLVFQFNEEEVAKQLSKARTLNLQLRQYGFKTALNHFGLSEDPKAILKHMDVDFVKFHGEFTRQLGDEKGSKDRFRSLLDQVHSSECASVIPQVEDASTLAQLWQYGVNYIQGYYLQPPHQQLDYDFDEN